MQFISSLESMAELEEEWAPRPNKEIALTYLGGTGIAAHLWPEAGGFILFRTKYSSCQVMFQFQLEILTEKEHVKINVEN